MGKVIVSKMNGIHCERVSMRLSHCTSPGIELGTKL